MIPSISSEKSCPHRYSEEEWLQLEIDCLECPGPQDLGNSKCLAGVVNVLAGGAIPESVVLRGYTHRRYRGDALDIATRAASAMARVNRTIASTERPSDRRCRTCPASMEQIMAAIKRQILARPEECLRHPDSLVSEIQARASNLDCQNSTACVNRSIAIGLAITGRR